jgi:predicted acetyltransferase
MLRQNYSTWGSGLSRENYILSIQQQLSQPWSRKNYRYFVARKNNAVVASCKLYTFDFQSRGRYYKVAGIGGVFTAHNHRGNGYASSMLEKVIRLARKEGYDALMLYSDIDPMFYELLDFEILPNNDFHIWTNTPEFEKWVMSGPGFVEDVYAHAPDVSTVSEGSVEEMVSHYRRYLATKPYGVVRTEAYWRYKLNRVLFRVERLPSWPALELLTLENHRNRGGYAIFEQGGKIMRVLEVVGGEESREILWRHLLRTALLRRIHLVRGWEAAAPDFQRHIRYTERDDWAIPMLLPINPATEAWLDMDSCPIFELDHF